MTPTPIRLACFEPLFGGDSSLAVESAWTLYAVALTSAVRRLTSDLDEREDLLQEARLALWKADATRYDLRDPDDVHYLGRVLMNRVWDVWGAEDARFARAAESRSAITSPLTRRG